LPSTAHAVLPMRSSPSAPRRFYVWSSSSSAPSTTTERLPIPTKPLVPFSGSISVNQERQLSSPSTVAEAILIDALTQSCLSRYSRDKYEIESKRLRVAYQCPHNFILELERHPSVPPYFFVPAARPVPRTR